jgi:precorrin-3B C17-methyltransferase
MPPGKIYVVGFGPGSHDHLTFRAKEAISEAEIVIGYTTYIELVRDLIDGKEVIQTSMQEEVSRAKKTVDLAEQGKIIAIVSSGDAGIYGMAGLIYEVLHERGWVPGKGVEVEVVPGVTAASSVAAIVGAPLVHDFAVISLSDLLTPLELIYKRVEAAAMADFVIAIYNPKSGRRTKQIVETQRIISEHRDPKTPVAIVKSAFRDAENVVLTDLEHMLDYEIGMLTTIIVGNSQTFVFEGKMVTPRGYARKYALTPEC